MYLNTSILADTDLFVTESTVNRTSLQFKESDTLPPLSRRNNSTIVQGTENNNLEMRSKVYMCTHSICLIYIFGSVKVRPST